jgi:hypothetical protein
MKIRLVLFFVLIVAAAWMQPVNTVVKSQALDMGKALVNGDSKTFSKYMLPEMLEAGGGTEKVGNMMDSMFTLFKSFGGSVKKITYGNPGKIIKFNKELQTTLPQQTEVTSPIADVVLTSTLVAISRDNGKNWYFYDTSMGKADQLKNKLPTLSPDIVIPPPVMPKIIAKEQ